MNGSGDHMLSEMRQMKGGKHSMFSLVWDVDLKRLVGVYTNVCIYVSMCESYET